MKKEFKNGIEGLEIHHLRGINFNTSDKSLDLILNIRNLLNLKMDIDKLIYDNISEKTEKDNIDMIMI